MRLRLVHQLSLLLFAGIGLAVLGMGLLTATQLRAGFNDYLRAQDEARLASFAQAALFALQRHGVDGLRRQPEALMAPLLGGAPPPGGGRLRNDGPAPPFREGRPPPPRAVDSDAPRGFSLLDRERRLIWGRQPRGPREPLVQAIHLDGELIAYAQLLPRPEAPQDLDARFLNRQLLGLAGVGLIVALVAGAAGLLLARRWARPLAAAQLATHRLAQGDFAYRLVHRPGRWHDEIDALALDLNHLAAALQRLEGSRRRWVAMLGHELRTPLTVLRGELDALADGVRTMDAQRLAALQAEVGRLTRLADDFALLARADLDQLHCEPRPLDPRPLLQAAHARWQAGMAAAGLRFTLRLQALPTTLQADADRLHQVLDNLLGNALAYTQAPGEVQLWAAPGPDGGLQIGVDDSPPGVADADERERLFEPLYRRDPSRRRDGGGQGLGLSIARALVQAHGGQLLAEDSPLGGLRLRICLP